MSLPRPLTIGLAVIGIATALSLAVAVREGRNNPMGCLEGRTDHLSHRNTVAMQMRMFAARGPASIFDVHRLPMTQLARGDHLAYFVLPERPDQTPIAINWSHLPRLYPPGAMLYHLPDAIFQEWLGASFVTANIFTVGKHVLAASALLALLLWLVLRLHSVTPDKAAFAVDVSVFALLGLELHYWALGGFFDVFPLGIVFGAIILLRLERPGLALLALLLAVGCHYRAVWYAPLGLYAAGRFVIALRKRPGGLRAVFAELYGQRRKPSLYLKAFGVLLVVILFLLSLWTFKLSSPALAQVPLTNPYRPGIPDGAVSFRLFLLMSALLFGLAVWRRHVALAMTIPFTTLMLYLTPHTQYWHSVWVFPMYAVAALWERPAVALRTAVFIWIAYITPAYFETNVFRLTAVREWIRLFTA